MTKKDLLNGLYDAGLITLGAVAVSMISKRLLKDDLAVPSTPQRILKLAAAVGAGSIAVKYAQTRKVLPEDPFK